MKTHLEIPADVARLRPSVLIRHTFGEVEASVLKLFARRGAGALGALTETR